MEDIKGTIIADLRVRSSQTFGFKDLEQNLIIKRFDTYENLERYLKSVRDNYRASDVSVKDKDFQKYVGEPCVWDAGKFELLEMQRAKEAFAARVRAIAAFAASEGHTLELELSQRSLPKPDVGGQ